VHKILIETLKSFGFSQVYYASNQNITVNILPQENRTPSDMQMYIYKEILDNTVAETTHFCKRSLAQLVEFPVVEPTHPGSSPKFVMGVCIYLDLF
jgi:hypothetical protein